jgi:carboxymethylenebutenolidase
VNSEGFAFSEGSSLGRGTEAIGLEISEHRVCLRASAFLHIQTLTYQGILKRQANLSKRVAMQEQFVEIKTADGVMEAFITHPEKDRPFPAVLIYMDIWGVREELYDIARRVGTVGYYCMVPDFYYRNGKRIHFEFRNEKNQTISINRLQGEQLREIQTRPQLTNKMVLDDTGAILGFLEGVSPVRRGGVGAIGFCMGGRYVMCAAGTYPERFVASVSLHGTTLISHRDDSPHRLAAKLRGEFYCGFAEYDSHAPLPMVQELEKLLKPCDVRYQFTVHPGAEHGYALPDRDVHDKRAAARDWESIFAMFHRQIPPYVPVI